MPLVRAPSISRLVPLMRDATGDERNTTPAATFLAVPIQPVGVGLIAMLNRSGLPPSIWFQISS